MKILKLSSNDYRPEATLSQYIGNSEGIIDGWKIVTDPECTEADAWWVMEGPSKDEKPCRIPDGSLFFATAEATWPYGFYSEYSYRTAFLNQFDGIHTCHDFYSEKTTSSTPFLPWMLNANHGDSISSAHARDIHFLNNLQSLPKTKLLSVFCSQQGMLPSHRLRLRFTQILKSHFGDDLDWYGNGFNSVPEKWNGLADYKFSIVLENQSRFNVITEKIYDPFLSLTYPIYWGAPNLSDYFDPKSFTPINLEDAKGSIKTIEWVLNNIKYDEVLPHLLESKRRVLNEQHFLKRMVRISEAALRAGNPTKKNIREVKDISSFYHLYPWKLRQLDNFKNKAATVLRKLS